MGTESSPHPLLKQLQLEFRLIAHLGRPMAAKRMTASPPTECQGLALRNGCNGAMPDIRRSAVAQFGVEGVAQGVAEEAEAEDG